jgi:phospholipase C
MRSPGQRFAAVSMVVMLAVACLNVATANAAPVVSRSSVTTTPIKHFVFLMQGDRTFDNYFGGYPGAAGLPPSTCQAQLPGRSTNCVKPFSLHGTSPASLGANPTVVAHQYDGGKMDGFVSALQSVGRDGTQAMGYYDQRDLPAYWQAASQYVLFDQFFSSTRNGERTNRSYWVAGQASPGDSGPVASTGNGPLTIFDRLQASGVSWKFYVQNYSPADTFRSHSQAASNTQTARVPLLNYARFVDNPSLRSHIVDMNQYYTDLKAGTLPAVAYIASSSGSERSGRSMVVGQNLVTSLTGQLMLSKYWSSSAFLWSYDGSGGWYDHVKPPQVDAAGYGLRVPALLVSAYANHGQVNHTVLDYTSALAFIEKNWGVAPLGGRDKSSKGLDSAFDFTSAPRPPQLISVSPAADPPAKLKSLAIVYWSYGLAIALVLVLLGFAAVRSSARRDGRPSTRDAGQREKLGVDAR